MLRILQMRSSSWVSMERFENILYTLVRWHESSEANHTTVLPCSSRVFFISSPMCIVCAKLKDSLFSGLYKQKRRGNLFCLFCNSGSSIALGKNKQRQSAHACMMYIDMTRQTDAKSPVHPVGIQSYHVDAFVAVSSFLN